LAKVVEHHAKTKGMKITLASWVNICEALTFTLAPKRSSSKGDGEWREKRSGGGEDHVIDERPPFNSTRSAASCRSHAASK